MPATGFSVILYVFTGHPDDVTKSSHLTKANEVAGVLFQDVEDVMRPYVEIDQAAALSPGTGKATFWTANYCYIQALHRYYFIESQEIIDNDHYVLRLRVDTLLTYRTDIRGTNFFVERNENAGSWMIPDPLIPMSSEITATAATVPTFQPFDLKPASDKPSYVVTVAGGEFATPAKVNQPDTHLKAVFLSPATSVFRYSLSRNATMKLADEISNATYVQHWFDDLKSGVMGLMAFPFEIPYTAAELAGIQIGTSNLTTGGYPLKGAYYEKSLKATLGTNFQVSLPSDFRIGNGLYEIRIFLPFVGWQQLNASILRIRPYINVEYKTNLFSGTGVCTVYAVTGSSSPSDAKDIIGQYEYVAGIQIPITINTAIDVTKNSINAALSSLLAVAGAVATENPALIGGAIASGAMNVGRAMADPVRSGSLGSSSFSNNPLYSMDVVLQYRKRVSPVLDDETQKTYFAARHGRVYQQSATLSSLTGRTVVRRFEMVLPEGCTMAEYNDIKAKLAEGVNL